MEKDNARGHLFQAGGVLLLALIVAIGEFAFISYIETSPNAVDIRSTPTINLSATDTPLVSQGGDCWQLARPPKCRLRCIQHRSR